MAGEKTEKATPKKRKEAREKGQVARSTDLQGAVVLIAGIVAIGSAGPGLVQRMGDVMRGAIEQISDPSIVSKQGIGLLMLSAGKATLLAVAPIALACMLGGIASSVGMVGFRPSGKALKPDFRRINPLSGAKNLFGPNALVETVKSIAKVGVVTRVVPQLNVFAVGFPAKIVVGLLLVAATLPFVAGWISSELQQDVGAALQAIRVA